jgi:hypothetical protein
VTRGSRRVPSLENEPFLGGPVDLREQPNIITMLGDVLMAS